MVGEVSFPLIHRRPVTGVCVRARPPWSRLSPQTEVPGVRAHAWGSALWKVDIDFKQPGLTFSQQKFLNLKALDNFSFLPCFFKL